jgi:hypothetical protein
MKASKYLLESWCSALPFWYSTLSQISDRTEPLFRGDADGLSVAIRYGASKSRVPTHNLVTIIESFLWWPFVGILLLSKRLNQLAILVDSSSLWTPYENRQLHLTQPHRWGRLLFRCPKLIKPSSCLKPCQLVVLSKSFQGWLPIAHFHQPWARVKVSW